MQLNHSKHGKYLLIQAEGRLDASWSDLFSERLLNHIREGEHQIIVDASGLKFLSSAGIRSLLIIYKELRKVNGSLLLVRAREFVRETLTISGFGEWLSPDFPDDFFTTSCEKQAVESPDQESYLLSENAGLSLSRIGTLFGEQAPAREKEETIAFGMDDFGLGIGEASQGSESDNDDRMGEFLAAAGHVVLQAPDERSRPDYLIAESSYVPKLKCRQMLKFSGEMSHHFRFKPVDNDPVNRISKIIDMVFELVKADASAFVITGEIEGLVGASLIQSPENSTRDAFLSWPGVRDRLSFCGERSYAGKQALITGIAARRDQRTSCSALYPMPSRPDLSVHIHAAVFPYQPLPNGRLELETSVSKFFSGPPPGTVMHLIDDNRPAIGLGESALTLGACWCGPLLNPEVLI